MLNETQTQCLYPLIHSLVHPHRDKTVKENHFQTEADRRQRKMSLPGKVGEMSHAVKVCVCVCMCVYVSADCELIRCLLIPYLSHLYFPTPFNPSS